MPKLDLTELLKKQTLLSRIYRTRVEFIRRDGRQPNVLLLHPERNWDLREELFASGFTRCPPDQETKVETVMEMEIHWSTGVDDFRLGYMLP